jgi:hypothetical protein
MGRAEDLFERLENRGLAAISEMFADAKAEEAFLDFKRSTDQGKAPKLDPGDRKLLSRALSGFSNSDGGIIVWGIGSSGGAQGDLATISCPLEDCKRFAAQIDETVSWGTVPPVPGVRSIAIPSGIERQGFVATLIPASEVGPHQATEGKQYLIRVGAGFQPVTHTVLAGMFGKRPQANVYHKYLVSGNGMHLRGSNGTMIEFSFLILLFNQAAVVALDSYVAWKAPRIGGTKSRLSAWADDPKRWQLDAPMNDQVGACLASETNRMAPFSHQKVLVLRLNIVPPIEDDLEIEFSIGCAGTAPKYDHIKVTKNSLEALARDSMPSSDTPGASVAIPAETLINLLGLASSR